MTKKDYELIAEHLEKAGQDFDSPELRGLARVGYERAVHVIADALAVDSCKFDRQRFLAACGVAS